MEFITISNLQGYSGVSLIHGLTHRETVLDSLLRDKVESQQLNQLITISIVPALLPLPTLNVARYKLKLVIEAVVIGLVSHLQSCLFFLFGEGGGRGAKVE